MLATGDRGGRTDPDKMPLLRYACIVPRCAEVGWARSGSSGPHCPKHEVDMKVTPKTGKKQR